MIWQFLGDNAWLTSTLMALAFLGAGVTMYWHMVETNAPSITYLVVVAMLILAGSFVLAGMSTGNKPIVTGGTLIPYIRLMWFTAASMINIFVVWYWIQRTQPKTTKKQEPPHGLQQTTG
jgi:hypothetical protein